MTAHQKPDAQHGDPTQVSPDSPDSTTIDRMDTLRIGGIGLDTLESIVRRPAPPSPYMEESTCQALVDQIVQIDRNPSEPAAEISLGMLGHYELRQKLGQGGMGSVYRAWHTNLGKQVALKILPADRMQDEASVARFHREMKAVGKLEHPNIIRAMDAGECDGRRYLAMELVEGRDLSTLAHHVGPLPVADACEIVRQAAVGLEHAHAHGMVHRDIKPSNLMLAPDGRVKVLDMGLALLNDPRGGEPDESTDSDKLPDHAELTDSGQVMGTLDYMAPEQGSDSHAVDIRADIHALGATLYKLLAGRGPFPSDEYDTPTQKLAALALHDPKPLASFRRDLPAGLVELIHAMLAKDPDARPDTPIKVAAALTPFSTGSDLPTLVARTMDKPVPKSTSDSTSGSVFEPEPVTSPSGPPPRRGRWAILAGGLAGAILLGVVLTLGLGKGTVVIEGPADGPLPEDISIVLAQDHRKIEIRSEDNWQLSVAPGEYQVEVHGGDDRFDLSSDTIRVTRFDKQIVSVRVSMPDDTRAGFVAEPAPIEGIDSWTIESRSVRAQVADMAFSPDGRMFAAAGIDVETVRVWDADSGELLQVLTCHPPDLDHRHDVNLKALSWSPDSRLLATGGTRDTEIWDVASGRKLRCWDSSRLLALAWSPDGRILAEATQVETILLRDPASGKVLRKIEGHAGRIHCVAWSPDGRQLASGGSDRIVTIWDTESGRPLHHFHFEMEKSPERILDIAWSPDGRVIAVSGSSQTHLVDSTTGELFEIPITRDADNEIIPDARSLAWSADGKTLLGCSSMIHGNCNVWACDGRTGKMLQSQSMPLAWVRDMPGRWLDNRSGSIHKIACSADGRKFAVAGGFGAVWLWQPAAGVFESNWRESARVLSKHADSHGQIIRFSGDGKIVAHACRYPPSVRLWETDSGKYLGQFDSNYDFELAPDGSQLVGSRPSDLSTALVWDTRSGEQRVGIRAKSEIHRIEWSPDGAIIAVGIGGAGRISGDIELRNAASGDLLHTLPQSRSFEFSPDSKRLLGFNSQDGTICLYEIEPFKRVWEIDSPPSLGYEEDYDAASKPKPFQSMAFSPDGKLLAGVRKYEVYLFEVESGKLVDRQSHADVGSVPLFWYDDGKKLRCGQAVWDMESNTMRTDQSVRIHALSVTGGIYASFQNVNVIELRRLSDNELLRTIVRLPEEQHAVISPEGHFIGSPGVEGELVYVVQTATGQQTLAPAEFAKQYGWKNDPSRVGPNVAPSTPEPGG